MNQDTLQSPGVEAVREYRCTRPQQYPPGTPGHIRLWEREGYYIRAKSEKEAFAIMQEKFPGEWIQVEVWKESPVSEH